MATFISHSPQETESLGAAWGRDAKPGWVVGLSGDLGAGKTQLVKGIAHGLNIPSRVHSPTFALVNIYTGGRLTLFHLDLYRLTTPEQVRAAGLEEYLHPNGVTVIEWAERLDAAAPDPATETSLHPVCRRTAIPFRRVTFEISGETERRISYEDFGS